MDGRVLTTTAVSWFALHRHDIDDVADEAPLTDEQALDLLNRLVTKLAGQQIELERFDRYYRGTQPLSFLHPEVALAIGDRLRSMVINWPRLVLDSLEERLDVEGFRVDDAGEPDTSVWDIWQANDFDLASGRVHSGSLRHGRSFVTVWYGDTPGVPVRLAPETARQMVVDYVPGTTVVRAAVKQWQDGRVRYATLYLPDRIVRYQRTGTTARSTARSTSWELRGAPIANLLHRVPVVPFLNRYDLDMPDGESELADVVHLADAINKLATDMMVASEFHAMPRRWATGIDIPKGPDRRRLEEEAKAYWERATAGKVWLGGKDINFGQFASADLANFVNAIGMLTAKVAALAGLPPHYAGIATDNPASADAIRSAETSLVRRAQRKQRTWSEPWEDVVELIRAVAGDNAAGAPATIETIWRDPQTPTVAQQADATSKLVDAGLIDVEQGQEDLGYTPVQRKRMRDRRLAALMAANYDKATADRLRDALAMVAEDGVDPKVAFAALGLLAPPKNAAAPGPEAPPPPAGDPGTTGGP